MSRKKCITELYPEISGQEGDVMQISVGAQDYFSDHIKWSPARDYRIGQQPYKKVDVFSVGRYFSFRFRTVGGAPWRLWGFKVSVADKGKF